MSANVVEILVKDRDEAKPDLTDLKARLAELGTTVETARANVDDADAAATLDKLKAQLIDLGKRTGNPKISLQGAVRAEAQIHAVEASLDRLGAREDEAKVKTSGLGSAFANLRSSLIPAFGEMSMFQKAMAGLNIATTFAEPLLAGVAVAAGGLASGLTAAGAGLGVFAVVAKSALSGASTAAASAAQAQTAYGSAVQAANLKYAQAVGAATTAQQRQAAAVARTDAVQSAALTRAQSLKAAYSGMSSAQVQLSKTITEAKNAWQGFVSANTAGVSQILSQGIGLLPRVFQLMQPFLPPVEKALSGLVRDLSAAIAPAQHFSNAMEMVAHHSGQILDPRGAGGLAKFIQLLSQNAGPAITKIGTALGHIGTGIAGILSAFMPMAQEMLSGLDKITAKFAQWGQTLSGHSGFKSMMQMFRTETPMAVGVLKNLGGIIKTVVSDMTGLSGVGNSKMLLQIAEPFTSLLKVLLKANPELVRFGLYALAAGSGLKKMKPAFEGIKSGIGLIKGGASAFQDLKAGFSNSAAAASDATGIWGTFGGKISSAVEAVKGWGIWSNIASAATKVWTGVQAAFDAVMDANPIAMIVIAVVALIAVIVLMVTHLHETAHIFDMVRHAGAEAFDAVRHAVSEAFDWIKGHWPLLLGILLGPFGAIAGVIIQFRSQILHGIEDVIDWIKDHWKLLLEILTGPIGLAVSYIVGHFDSLRHDIESAFDDIRHTIASALDDMLDDVHNWESDVVGWFERLPGRIVSGLGDLGHLLWNAGASIIHGLLGGIESAVGGLIGSVEHIAGDISGAFSKVLSIFSPSRVFHRHGQMIAQGLINGMDSMRGPVAAAAGRMARTAQQGAAVAYGPAGGGYGAAGAGGGQMEVTLRFEGAETPLVKALFRALKAEVKVVGGGGTNSAQRAWGQIS